MKTLVGTLTVTEAQKSVQYYEVAAWSTTHILQPGTYPVYAATHYGKRGFVVFVDTIVESSNTPSLFGGVRVGEHVDHRAGTKDQQGFSWGYYEYRAGQFVPFERIGIFKAEPGANLQVGDLARTGESACYARDAE